MAGIGAAAAWPLAARGQQPGRVRLIGMLIPYPEGDATMQARVRSFRQQLTRLGWPEGGAVQFDERWTTDNMDHVRIAAASLVALSFCVAVRLIEVGRRQIGSGDL